MYYNTAGIVTRLEVEKSVAWLCEASFVSTFACLSYGMYYSFCLFLLSAIAISIVVVPMSFRFLVQINGGLID